MGVYQGLEQLIVPRSMRQAIMMCGKMILLGCTLGMWSSGRFLADVAQAKKLDSNFFKSCCQIFYIHISYTILVMYLPHCELICSYGIFWLFRYSEGHVISVQLQLEPACL